MTTRHNNMFSDKENMKKKKITFSSRTTANSGFSTLILCNTYIGESRLPYSCKNVYYNVYMLEKKKEVYMNTYFAKINSSQEKTCNPIITHLQSTCNPLVTLKITYH